MARGTTPVNAPAIEAQPAGDRYCREFTVRTGRHRGSGRRVILRAMVSAPADRFVVNLIEDTENRLLFLKRSENLERAPGKWGFCSGRIERGESPGSASTRELREELGESPRLELKQAFGPVRDRLLGGRYEFHLFHFRWAGGTIRLNREHTAFAWLSREQFRDYDVMPGLDEDILYLGIWQRDYLREELLPPVNAERP